MPLNNVTAFVSVNGGMFPVIDAEVTAGKTKKADEFRATLSLTYGGAIALADASGASVTIMLGGAAIPGSFQLEHVDVDFEGTKVTISGRDAAAASLIDNSNTQTFTNQSPQQVVQAIASGIPVQMDSIGGMAGKIYDQDWNAITHRVPRWDSINRIADIYGLNAFVTGGTLYLKDVDFDWPPISIFWSPPENGPAQSNFLKLKCSRNFQMSKQINVTATSYNYRKKKLMTGRSTAGGSGSGRLDYSYPVAGHTQDQVDNLAKKKAKEHSKHAFDVEVEIPGDASITPLMSLQLIGTGSVFDQNYDVDGVTHKVSFDGGFTTTIKGKTDGGDSGGAGDSGADE